VRVTPLIEAGFRARVLQDCLATALPSVWERRAAAWEDARPRLGDYNGCATPDELVDRDIRCRQIAQACRSHAQVLRTADVVPLEVEVVRELQEVA
jgi:hypothetical protein